MSAGDHPEQLIDLARQGGLTPEAQATLERHLRECAACARQVALAGRFERDLAPQPRDELMYQRAVDGALAQLQKSAAGRRRRALSQWSRWAAAGVLVIAGVTAAAAVVGRRIAPRPPEQRLPIAEAARAPVSAAPVEAPPPEAPAATAVAPTRALPSSRGVQITAGELFEKGEKLRREGRADAAIATYRRLQSIFPESAEARLSFAFAGKLLLEQGRDAEALAQFDRHLKLDGEVAEEALAGRATALEQLHRTSEAAAAWKSLLARYPRSIYAERARARLEQLAGHP